MVSSTINAATDRLSSSAVVEEALLPVLAEIVRRYGTPTYAFDLQRLRGQVAKLRSELPAGVEILYSLKANASLGICEVFEECGLGADVASAGELATALSAGYPDDRLFVAGPFKLAETVAMLRELPRAIVSVDSPSELRTLADQSLDNHCVLRLRPDFGSQAVVAAGRGTRFGFTTSDLISVRDFVARRSAKVVGFHIFAGSQVLQAEGIVEHLRGAYALAVQAAEILGIAPTILNLGGGFGIPYAAQEQELDLRPIASELQRIVADHTLQPRPRIVLELGRYLVAQAGWYLTSVVGHQSFQDRPAVVVDGGTHQRADLCGLCLRTKARPPVVLSAQSAERVPTDVWGCLSLPADVMAEASLLPPLIRGDVLAFPNAGAYGMWSSPALFHGSPLPAEVGFDGETLHLMRERQSARSILHDQRHIQRERDAS